MMQFLKNNGLFFALLGVAIVVYSLFVLPWLQDIGHPGLSVPGYAFFVMLVVYGRANRHGKKENHHMDSED